MTKDNGNATQTIMTVMILTWILTIMSLTLVLEQQCCSMNNVHVDVGDDLWHNDVGRRGEENHSGEDCVAGQTD